MSASGTRRWVWLAAGGAALALLVVLAALASDERATGAPRGLADAPADEPGAPADELALPPESAPRGAAPAADPRSPAQPVPLHVAPSASLAARSPELEPLLATGRVVDAHGAPVPDAELFLLPDHRALRELGLRTEIDTRDPLLLAPDDLPRTRTDAEGRFELLGAWAPTSRDRLPRRQFNDPTLLVRSPRHALHAFACFEIVDGAHDAGELRLVTPAGSVHARFVDDTGAPLEGVRVELEFQLVGATLAWALPELGAPFFPVESDGNGIWSIDHQWPGNYTLRFRRANHDGSEQKVSLALGERRDLGTVALPRSGTIAGTIRDVHGQPLAGARVAALSRPRFDHPAVAGARDPVGAYAQFQFPVRETVLSDASGRYLIAGLRREQGGRRVIAQADGHEAQWVDEVVLDRTGVDLVLAPEARLSVVAVDAASGETIGDFELRAARDLDPGGPTRRGFASRFVRLPVEGSVVHRAGLLGTRLLVRAPGFEWTLRDVPGLAPGEHRELRVALDPAHRLRLRLMDDRGEAVPGASVRLASRSEWGAGLLQPSDHLDGGRADGSGVLELEGIPAGEWAVSAEAEGHRGVIGHAFDMPPADHELELALPRAPRLLVRVRAADGSPAAGVRVLWNGEVWSHRSDLTDEEGRFEVRRPGRRGTLTVPRAAPLELELAPGEVREVELTQGAPFAVEGRVLRGGEPVARARVELRGPAGLGIAAEFAELLTDADGGFRFLCEYVGSYSVTATFNGVEERAELQAVPGGRCFVELRFGGAVLSGVVRPASAAVDPAVVRVSLARDGVVLARQQPDTEGRFAFTGLAAGTYELGTYGGGTVGETWGPYELAADAAREDLLLTPGAGARLHGRALHADGAPFDGYVHLRSDDGTGYELSWVSWRDGSFEFRGVAPGTWRLDLAKQHTKVLGDGPEGVGEPGAELPFFGGTTLSLAPGEVLELDVTATGAGTAR